MSTFKFYKVADKWYVQQRPSFEVGKPVDLVSIEKVFGITGTREVMVTLPEPGEGKSYRVVINNGFITDAFLAVPIEQGFDMLPIQQFITKEMK